MSDFLTLPGWSAVEHVYGPAARELRRASELNIELAGVTKTEGHMEIVCGPDGECVRSIGTPIPSGECQVEFPPMMLEPGDHTFAIISGGTGSEFKQPGGVEIVDLSLGRGLRTRTVTVRVHGDEPVRVEMIQYRRAHLETPIELPDLSYLDD